MTKKTSTEPIEQHSGKSWAEWVAYFDNQGCRSKLHPDITKFALKQIEAGWWDIKSQPNVYWWAQSIAIAYEQHVGLRTVGQQSDGMYAATVSKTVSGVVKDLRQKWCRFDIGEPHTTPRISHTPKRSYWRVDLPDDTKTEVAFEAKSEDKVLITISQSKIADHSLVDSRKEFWRSVLDSFIGGISK